MAKRKSSVKMADSHCNGNGLSTSKVAGKSTESISNLTRPQLYSLYDEDITKSGDAQVYEEIRRSRGKVLDDNGFTLEPRVSRGFSAGSTISNLQDTEGRLANSKRPWYGKLVHFIFATAVLSITGIAYHELSRRLHDNHLLHPDFASRPLLLGVQISRLITGGMVPDWTAYALEGIIFGLSIPLMDYLFGIKTKRNSWASIMKSANAMLGVTFGIRKVQWTSSQQAAGAWGLLNIILWLFFDGTMSMFIGCSSLGLLACATCYKDVTDRSQLLYFMDFYFLGLMLFGKLGRNLFSQ